MLDNALTRNKASFLLISYSEANPFRIGNSGRQLSIPLQIFDLFVVLQVECHFEKRLQSHPMTLFPKVDVLF